MAKLKIKKAYKTVKLQTGRMELKLTNYKPKLNDRILKSNWEPPRITWCKGNTKPNIICHQNVIKI